MLQDKIAILQPYQRKNTYYTLPGKERCTNPRTIHENFIYVVRGSNKRVPPPPSKAVHTTNDSVAALVNIYGDG
jgi:hypothetical protein